MKYILFLLSTLLLFSCKTTYNNYSSYDEVYDTYKPTEEIISSDQVEQTEPVNIYFIEYDLWTYRYPYYRRSWFYNNYNYNWNYNWNWSIYSPNYYYWHLYQPNYWNLGNNWNYYCGAYNYPYYTNYWNNNWYGNNYWYSNQYHPYHNYFINNNKPILYGHRTVKNPTTIQKPNLHKPTYDKVPVERRNPAPVERPKKDPYIYSRPNTQPVRVESKPSKIEDTRTPVRTQPNPPVRTQPVRTNQPQRVQPSQNKQPNIQRNVNPQPQKNNKPKR